MARVFTWDELRTDAIPRPEAFSYISNQLRRDLAAEPAVIGALLYGSTLRGDCDERSDIDALLIYRPGTQEIIVSLQQHLRSAAAGRFVPLRIIAVDSELALRGSHSFYPMYHAHLCGAACAGGIIKEDPLSYIAPKRMTYLEEVHGYLVRKCGSFDRALESLAVMSDAELAAVLGKALSFPVHAARKMLQCLAPDFDLTDDSKAVVRAHYQRLNIAHSVDLFHELLGMERRYVEALAELRVIPNINRHVALMNQLKPALMLAHQFARLNLLALPAVT